MTVADSPNSRRGDSAASQGLWAGLARIKSGELGILPILLGLIVICVVFQTANPNFLTPLNLTNLMVQVAAVGTISVGLVLVLLLGEIDLSVGAVSGLAAAVMAVAVTKHGVPGWAAMALGIGAGAVIGWVQGAWLTKMNVPSFIVTLAGLLIWQGALLYVLGPTGTINLSDPVIVAVANWQLPVVWTWTVIAPALIVYIGGSLRARARRQREQMATSPWTYEAMRLGAVCAGIVGAAALMSMDRSNNPNVEIRGVPLGVVFFVGFVAVLDLTLRRTRYGRYMFAVGGNREAARRAGINVDRICISAFVVGSSLAACGGILAASRLYAVNQASGAGDVLLSAVAAPVIGGTSLFGGRGSAWSALLGVLVIGSISNGMDLLALSSSIKLMVTGAVLLAAVTVDALARRSRQAAAR